jgi:hypothetical protein
MEQRIFRNPDKSILYGDTLPVGCKLDDRAPNGMIFKCINSEREETFGDTPRKAILASQEIERDKPLESLYFIELVKG